MRKTPIRHVVKPYKKEDGTTVRQHVKGNGVKKATYREGSIIPEYLEERMKEKDREWQISEIERIKANARISPHLRSALDEITDALKSGNMRLASELTSVKSYITGSLDTKDEEYKHHFNEDAKYNEKVLGRDVYGILDSMHHDIAFSQGEIPSGATIFSADGARSRGPPALKSPTLRMIRREHDDIYKSVQKRWAKK